MKISVSWFKQIFSSGFVLTPEEVTEMKCNSPKRPIDLDKIPAFFGKILKPEISDDGDLRRIILSFILTRKHICNSLV